MAERIDDLQCRGYRILQDSEGFCFGMDAVLLANFAAEAVTAGQRTLDLGCGNGIIPILLAAKTEAAELYGLEIQEKAAALARRSVGLNGETERIRILRGDLREIRSTGLGGTMDVVTANPPYMRSGIRNPDSAKLIARHEVLCDFHDVASAAAYALKSGGKFFLVHRPHRLADVLCELRSSRLEPKRMQMVHPYREREANLFVLEAVKDAGRELRVLPPLIVYSAPNMYTAEALRRYRMGV